MPKKETPGVVRQDGTRGGGHCKAEPLAKKYFL